MKDDEFLKAMLEHKNYQKDNPPFCVFCGDHHIDLEKCLPITQ